MDDATLESTILNDSELKQMAILGQDGDISRSLTKENTSPSLTIEGLLSVLSTESAAKLAVNPNTTDLRDKILSADTWGIKLWIAIFYKAGMLTDLENTTINGAVDASVPNGVIITTDQVSKVLKKYRTNGKVGQVNWTGG